MADVLIFQQNYISSCYLNYIIISLVIITILSFYK